MAMSTDARMSVQAVQALVERTMRGLGPYAGKLCYVPAQRQLDTPAMRNMGFARVKMAYDVDVEDLPSHVKAAIVTTVGADVSGAAEIIRSLNENDTAPAIIVIVLVPFFASDSAMTLEDDGYGPYTPNAWLDASDPAGCIELGRFFNEIRVRLLSEGADESLCLFAGEDLKPHRILEVVHKSELMAKKMSDIINMEVNVVESNAARKVQLAYRKFLMILPGRVFENIPYEDKSLKEVYGENGQLEKVGPYELTLKIGSGTFGKVYKAESQEGVPLAVKVTSKANVKTAGMILAVDRELCILLYMPPHPNIIRAFHAMHGKYNYYVVMEYGGRLHLQNFTKTTLTRSGGTALPDELITRFSRQQASALAHLFGCRVCHRDVKPDNWIVADTGRDLRLADFSLAVQVTSPWQPLRSCCGSLPFCAPEVYGAELADSKGYNGLTADTWSLAVNFMELLGGPYSVEKMIGWIPQHPAEDDTVLEGLRSLATRWVEHPMKNRYPLGTAITDMLVLRPAQRMRMDEVAALLGARHEPPPIDFAGLGSAAEQPGSCASSSEADIRGPPQRLSSALSVKLGGPSGLSTAFDQMLDRFMFTPCFGEVFETCPEKLPAIRTFFVSEMICIFETAAGSGREESSRLRNAVRELLSGIAISQVHFAVMVEQLRVAFEFLAVEDDAAAEAVARFRTFGPDFTAGCTEKLAKAREQNTSEWRSTIMADARRPWLEAFSDFLVGYIARSPVLNRTLFVDFSKSDFESNLLSYLGSLPRPGGTEIATSVVPVPEEVLGKDEHLAATHAARNALAHAGWSEEVVDTLYFTMLEEWLRLCDRAAT